MIRLLQSSWAVMLLGSALYLGVTAHLLTPARVRSGKDHAPAGSPNTRGASWDLHHPELDRLMEDLAKERKAVATREAQLNELSTRLEAERAELNIILRSVQRRQKEFDRSVLRVQGGGGEDALPIEPSQRPPLHDQ